MLEDIQKVVNYFQLQPFTILSSDEKDVPLSQEWLELIQNNDYFFKVEDDQDVNDAKEYYKTLLNIVDENDLQELLKILKESVQ